MGSKSFTDSIEVDSAKGIPIWVQLRNQIIYQIEIGTLTHGQKLPTVREMAVSLGVNYNTVSKVYQDIERDGYIVSLRGKGTFVCFEETHATMGVKTEQEALADEFIRRCLELGLHGEDIVELVNRRAHKL